MVLAGSINKRKEYPFMREDMHQGQKATYKIISIRINKTAFTHTVTKVTQYLPLLMSP